VGVETRKCMFLGHVSFYLGRATLTPRSFLPLERVEGAEITVLDRYPWTDCVSRLWYRLTYGRVVGEGHGVGGVIGISKG
jgi:hypothetical protein